MRKKGFIPLIFTVVFALLVFGCEEITDLFSEGIPEGNAAYFAIAHGYTGSIESRLIVFTFNQNINALNLSLNDIILTDFEGRARKDDGILIEGHVVTIGINVLWPGNILVSINKPGIEAAVKTVLVHREPIDYSIHVDGDTIDENTTRLRFIFHTPLANSPADIFTSEIIVEEPTALVGTGEASIIRRDFRKISPSEYDYIITVNWPGTVKVRMDKLGVNPDTKDVTVFKHLDETTYHVTADGLFNQGNTTLLRFTFNNYVFDGQLQFNEIFIDSGVSAMPGSANKVALTNINNQVWELTLNNIVQGDIRVRIGKQPIDDATKTVFVYHIPNQW